jgi:cytochrome oxidase Cu insertion factor (SCO1/SenC/PrrC family)
MIEAGSSADTRSRSRRPFYLVAALFLLPLAAAFVIYYGFADWRPGRSTANGDLIHPARPLPEVALDTPAGRPTEPDFLRGHWSMVYVGAGGCDVRCREALTDMRQVRLALGDDMTRVERVFLHTDECCDAVYLDAEHPGLVVAWLDAAAGRDLLARFPRYDGVTPERAGRIGLVDPRGYLMMSCAREVPAKGLLADLKNLLKLSHIG